MAMILLLGFLIKNKVSYTYNSKKFIISVIILIIFQNGYRIFRSKKKPFVNELFIFIWE